MHIFYRADSRLNCSLFCSKQTLTGEATVKADVYEFLRHPGQIPSIPETFYLSLQAWLKLGYAFSPMLKPCCHTEATEVYIHNWV